MERAASGREGVLMEPACWRGTLMERPASGGGES